jgi:hypothetical protein
VWESSDALTWTKLAGLPGRLAGAGGTFSAAGIAGTPGAGVLASLETGDGWTALFAASTGKDWRRLARDSGCGRNGPEILPPASLDAWVVIGGLRVCTSRDLVTWSATNLDAALYANAQTRYGAVLTGDACYDEDATCTPAPRAWISVDGTTWTRLANPPAWWGPTGLADGPAGVLLIGSGAIDHGPDAWRLAP